MSFEFAGCPAVFNGQSCLAIKPQSARMQRYGKAIKCVFKPNILADWIVCIEETLGCFAP